MKAKRINLGGLQLDDGAVPGLIGISAAVNGNDGVGRNDGVVPAGDEIKRNVETARLRDLLEGENMFLAGAGAAL